MPPRSDEWREFVDAIPQHWLDEVSRIAVSMSEEWRKFADRLGNKADRLGNQIADRLGNKMEAAS